MVSISPSRPPVGHVAAQQPSQRSDLLSEAVSAYDAQQDAANIYRELAIGREFRQRFGVTPEPPMLSERTDFSRAGVFTFRAGGLAWKGGDDGAGAARTIWFCVKDLVGSWHEANSKEQLGQLVRRGVQFGAAS